MNFRFKAVSVTFELSLCYMSMQYWGHTQIKKKKKPVIWNANLTRQKPILVSSILSGTPSRREGLGSIIAAEIVIESLLPLRHLSCEEAITSLEKDPGDLALNAFHQSEGWNRHRDTVIQHPNTNAQVKHAMAWFVTGNLFCTSIPIYIWT